MSEANKQLVRRWFEEVWNQKNEAAIDVMFNRKGKSHGFPEADSVLTGPEAFKEVHRIFCGAFSDIQVTIEENIAEGDRVACRWTVVMTHTGDNLGFSATGKTARQHGASFLIIRDGQILEGWNEVDMSNLFNQLKS